MAERQAGHSWRWGTLPLGWLSEGSGLLLEASASSSSTVPCDRSRSLVVAAHLGDFQLVPCFQEGPRPAFIRGRANLGSREAGLWVPEGSLNKKLWTVEVSSFWHMERADFCCHFLGPGPAFLKRKAPWGPSSVVFSGPGDGVWSQGMHGWCILVSCLLSLNCGCRCGPCHRVSS